VPNLKRYYCSVKTQSPSSQDVLRKWGDGPSYVDIHEIAHPQKECNFCPKKRGKGKKFGKVDRIENTHECVCCCVFVCVLLQPNVVGFVIDVTNFLKLGVKKKKKKKKGDGIVDLLFFSSCFLFLGRVKK